MEKKKKNLTIYQETDCVSNSAERRNKGGHWVIVSVRGWGERKGRSRCRTPY